MEQDTSDARWVLEALAGSRGRKAMSDLRAPGLLALDLQRLFCDPASPAYVAGWSAAAPHAVELIRAFLDAGRPVAFSRHLHPPDDPGGLIGRFFGRLIRASDPLSDLLPELGALATPAVVLEKSRHSAFSNPQCAPIFSGCDSLVLVGVQTPLCVLATALDAARHALVPVVVADACASRDHQSHRASLTVLASGHAQVALTAEARALLGGET